MQLSEKNLLLRKGRVTASGIAALLPCGHPYFPSGAVDMYAQVAEGVTRPASRWAEMGHVMEDVVFAFGKREVPNVRQNSRTYVHKTLPIAATLDGIVLHEPGVVECKTVFNEDVWRDRIPPHVVAQVQTQMLVTGREYALVWALMVRGMRFVQYRVEADREWQQGIEYAVWRFFRDHVEPKVPPEPVPDRLALTVYRPQGTIAADERLERLARDVLESQAVVGAFTEELESRRGELAAAMAAADAKKVIGKGWLATARETKTGAMSLYVQKQKRG